MPIMAAEILFMETIAEKSISMILIMSFGEGIKNNMGPLEPPEISPYDSDWPVFIKTYPLT